MNNAFEVWRELKSIYLKYIDTGLPIKYKKLEEERKVLLLELDAICKLPIIEFVPRYDEYKTLNEACRELELNTMFASFAKAGLFPDRERIESKIYKHQYDSLKFATKERKHIIATTGTGSGKTECFLFPLIYDVLKEKLGNDANQYAMRGLILYPLNALAEDQMRRLRKSLSSINATNWLDQNASKKRITFGRYTGITPISGKETEGKKRILKQERVNLERDWKSAKDQAVVTDKPDYLYDNPNMDDDSRAEYWDRWTMQKTPPDILITNYSMLNIMLMREQEQNIFEQTKLWLESDPSHVFHLVVDELHSYRGTSGTEVSYLIRLLLLRLGLTPDSKQVQFLCSSASMQETERTKKFISGFFGLARSEYENKFKIISDPTNNLENKNFPILKIEELEKISNADKDEITAYFQKYKILDSLKFHVPRSLESDKIAEILFPNENDKLKALEFLLIGLSKLKNTKDEAIQPQRAHYFFRNIEGLWACTNQDCTEVPEIYKYEDRKIGRLYRKPLTNCKCGSVVLEALLCRHCGEIYLGGWHKKEGNLSYLSIEKDLTLILIFTRLFIQLVQLIILIMDGYRAC